jgi:hypothetical protein
MFFKINEELKIKKLMLTNYGKNIVLENKHIES